MKISKINKTLRFCAWLDSLYSWRQDQIVEGFIWTKQYWKFLFWKDLVQGLNHGSIFINGKDWMQILTLMHYIIHNEQRLAKRGGWRRTKGEKKFKIFKEKVLIESCSTGRLKGFKRLIQIIGSSLKPTRSFARPGMLRITL